MEAALSPSSAYVSDQIKDLAYVLPPRCLRIVPHRELRAAHTGASPGAIEPQNCGMIWVGRELKAHLHPCHQHVHLPLDL